MFAEIAGDFSFQREREREKGAGLSRELRHLITCSRELSDGHAKANLIVKALGKSKEVQEHTAIERAQHSRLSVTILFSQTLVYTLAAPNSGISCARVS